ncbi:substrate-binding domain-containing protein [Paenibacillus thailandensis]|uniref:Substrate-binding domain-containing protein n=1 Tax=Paenibacillus thailandensis TaxID=393250 RepID=A0ABW5QRM0_9BACL
MNTRHKWLAAMTVMLAALLFVLYEFVTAAAQNVKLVREMENGAGHPSDKRVILISQEQNTPYWQMLEQGVAEAADELGIGVEYWAPYRTNPEEQINLLAKAIAAKPDAVLIQGIKGDPYDRLIDQAEEAGIAVVTVDSDAPESKRLAYVGTDNLAAGRLLGELVAGGEETHGSIGVIISSPEADNQQLRLKGFRSVVESADGYTIAAIGQSKLSRIEAARQTVEMLTAHPEISTMVGLSGLDAPGIAEGVKVAGRTDVRVFGFDDLEATREAIAAGSVAATVVQQPKMIGQEAIRLLNRYFAGESVSDISYTPFTVLNGSNLNGTEDGSGQGEAP